MRQSGKALVTEEPDVLTGHVRVRGGLAGNRWVYPEIGEERRSAPREFVVMYMTK
jgi:hypothetical protein